MSFAGLRLYASRTPDPSDGDCSALRNQGRPVSWWCCKTNMWTFRVYDWRSGAASIELPGPAPVVMASAAFTLLDLRQRHRALLVIASSAAARSSPLGAGHGTSPWR